MARAEFAELQALEEEHPRWEEDDEVRPKRDELYHRAIDRFLFAYLHYGSQEEEAARGLWGALEAYQFGGETARARECANDIEGLYPGTEFAGRASAYLKQSSDEGEATHRK